MKHKITLLEGEKILYETPPLSNIKKYYFVTYFFFSVACLFTPIILVTGLSLIAPTSNPLLTALFFLLAGILLFTFVIILPIIVSNKAYQQRYYWITNKRVIYRRGLLGYKITSIPYERISDVIISRTFFENLFGFGSLQIQTLAGQLSSGVSGSEGDLRALPNPEEAQQLILNTIKERKFSL